MSSKPQAKDSCFVMMPFKEPFNTYYRDIIVPSIEEVSLRPQRGDSLFRPTPIMGDVWSMIQSAKVLIADLTEKNPNVFYELGLAHAIGKSIVLITGDIDDVPFDLQSLRVHVYDKNHPTWGNLLHSKIVNSLREILADTSSAVPPMFRKIVISQAPAESEVLVRIASIEQRIDALLISSMPNRSKAAVSNNVVFGSEYICRTCKMPLQGESDGGETWHYCINEGCKERGTTQRTKYHP